MNLDDLSLYLPKYLSEEASSALFNSLRDFPSNVNSKFYSNKLNTEEVFFQGDRLKDVSICDCHSEQSRQGEAIVISNTCDIDSRNPRLLPMHIVLAPIVKMSKLLGLLKSKDLEDSKIENFTNQLKQQKISHLFYLPGINEEVCDAVVFLDKMFNLSPLKIDANNFKENRISVLSDYGFYVFLFKLSIHFTRIREGVERGSM